VVVVVVKHRSSVNNLALFWKSLVCRLQKLTER